jgi:leader peptidase (prepilin peptidase)/N-methyltransferase
MLGALSASLVCLLIDRRAGSERIATTHSHCACGRTLRLTEVIPVFSWLRVRGVAPCCSTRLTVRHPLFEASLGLIWGLSVALVAPPVAAVLLVIATALVASAEYWSVSRSSSA